MKRIIIFFTAIALFSATLVSCNSGNSDTEGDDNTAGDTTQVSEMQQKVDEFVTVRLTGDLSSLSENQKKMLPLLFEAAQIMDDIYWTQAYGDKEALLADIEDEATKKFVMINYGPWERLNGNAPFIEGAGEKPAGANFYPADMTKEEFEQFADEDKNSMYTLLRRNDNGELITIWYHEAYKEQIEKAAALLKEAAALAEDEGFKNYLELRAEALLTDEYFDSDMAWMDMKNNKIDYVVGPIENYEDGLFNLKAAHEAFILIKDMEWSQRLDKYTSMLPELQAGLPVPAEYKAEKPGSNSDLNAYEVVYYAGDCNAGSKTIAINLPNDPDVQLAKGSRRLQLKNAMRAKFDQILVPIADILITPEQRENITFDAFFSNTMFHEVAHGLGIKKVLGKDMTVREAMQDYSTALEEGKADILGLYLVTKLHEKGELGEADLMDNYVTFLAGIFRSIRFGSASSHGKANLIRYNYFKEHEAFTINEDGTYTVNFEKMQEAMNSLSEMILTIQGDGDLEAAKQLVAEKAVVPDDLQAALDRIAEAGIPRDIVFEQGVDVVGL